MTSPVVYDGTLKARHGMGRLPLHLYCLGVSLVLHQVGLLLTDYQRYLAGCILLHRYRNQSISIT